MKRALLVGLDDYPGTANDLNSCVKDIAAWRSILIQRYAFTREEVRLLLDSRATKKEVMSRLGWLVSGAGKGDTLVFIYSGHGTTFTERSGDGRLDEAKDEALCLYGSEWRSSLLIDDELSSLVNAVPADVNLTIICDSCFSGGMDKDVFKEIGMSKYARNKYLPPPIDIAHRDDPHSPVRKIGLCLSRDKGLDAARNREQSESKALVLAACRENETAGAARSDTDGLSVFSHYAISALTSFQVPPTARQLLGLSAQKIADAGHPQVPQLKGRMELFDIPLFGPIG